MSLLHRGLGHGCPGCNSDGAGLNTGTCCMTPFPNFPQLRDTSIFAVFTPMSKEEKTSWIMNRVSSKYPTSKNNLKEFRNK